MADEITLTVGLGVRKDNLLYTVPNSTTRHDLAGSLYAAGVQSIGTTHEPLDLLSGLATPGFGYFHNLDDENFVEIGIEVADAFYSLLKLDAGQVAILPLSTLAVYAQADTDPVQLQYTVFER